MIELVRRVLKRDLEATEEAIDSLVEPTRILYNVAERLLTGRRAEEYFIGNYNCILNLENVNLFDKRTAAVGYDFEIDTISGIAIEVKGIKKRKGYIQFTDKEWKEAKIRRDSYWLVVVGNLEGEPSTSLIRDPSNVLDASCRYQKTISASWSSVVCVP